MNCGAVENFHWKRHGAVHPVKGERPAVGAVLSPTDVKEGLILYI